MEKRQAEINYQKKLDKLLAENIGQERVKRLLLHSCCAPCSSYVLEYLSEYFEITIFYYNPNIYPPEEYAKRVYEQQDLIKRLNPSNPIFFLAGDYDHSEFLEIAKGLSGVPEGGRRCFKCYELRMRQAAKQAALGCYDYFTTTLSISPMKNAARINEIGERIAAESGVRHLPSDFKKRGGYQRSIELSKEYGLYRQDYCGCEFSIR